MAGMFYSLQEALDRLNKTEDELQQMVDDGKLREFRDGPNVLYKVEEVEELASEADNIGLEETPEFDFSETEEPGGELPDLDISEDQFDAAEFPDLEIAEEETPGMEAVTPEISDEELSAAEDLEAEPLEPAEETASGSSEIFLAPETGAPVVPSDLTDADTALTGMGTSVLGETDADYDITDDTMAETAIPTGGTGTSPEVPLEEIEEDVNLDSFGSGSGLLDLSLQADDTSLGGILDEIYTAEGEGGEMGEAEGEGSGEALPAEPEPSMAAEDELGVPAQGAADVMAFAGPVVEMPPDAQSNTLGMLLFLPMVIVIYTAVVAVSGLKGVMPSVLPESIRSFIWYIMAGAAGITGLVAVVAFVLTGERGTKVKKEPKPKKVKVKKPKEPKPKKVKKAK